MEINISSKAAKELLENSIVDFSKPFDPSQYTFNNDITVTEDQALSMNIELGELLLIKFKEGYRIKHKYQHPAVGLVVVMYTPADDADLSSIK